MGALNDLASNSVTQATTMPTWYDSAQQAVVNQAAQGAAAVPKLGQTVAGQAINQLSGAANPFTQAQGTLNQIATGAANPWITDASGQVTPNTNTALGGLFQAQNQQLNQLLPNVTAPVEGANIASGNFGSLRGQTAVDKAKADALATLNTAQMQAALQNQQTGVSAATGLGNVGSQGVTSETTLGQAQQADPLLAASGLGKIVAGINAPSTVTSQTQLSPLNLAGTLASALGGSVAGVNSLLTGLGVTGGLGGLLGVSTPSTPATTGTTGSSGGVLSSIGKLLGTGGTTPTQGSTATPSSGTTGTKPSTSGLPSSSGSATNTMSGLNGSGITTDANGNPVPGTYRLADGSAMTIGSDGSMTIAKADGSQQVFDANGNQISNTDANGNPIADTGNVTPPDTGTVTPPDTGNVTPPDNSGNLPSQEDPSTVVVDVVDNGDGTTTTYYADGHSTTN